MLDRLFSLFRKGAAANKDQKAALGVSAAGELTDISALLRLPYDYLELTSALPQTESSDTYTTMSKSLTGVLYQPGEVIEGTYEVLDLAHSALGPVYLVHHLVWDKDLRIVMPLASYCQEAAARARLSSLVEKNLAIGLHPNLVAVLACRSLKHPQEKNLSQGRLAIITEARLGSSLSERMALPENAHGLPDWTALLDIAMQICLGLAFAHSSGLFHANLSPDCCFIERNGTVHVDEFFCNVSWGNIKELNSKVSKDKTIKPELMSVLPGEVGACPVTLSPRRWRNPGPATRLDNIWSLGVILYYMVSGRLPFLPYARHGEGMLESLKYRVLTETAVPVRELRADVPAALNDLICGCLDPKESQRPANAEAVFGALDQIYSEVSHHAWPRPVMAEDSYISENRNNEALALYDTDNKSGALEKLRQSLEFYPDLYEARVNMAMLSWLNGEISIVSAIRQTSEVAAVFPEANLPLIWLLGHSGDESRALKLLDEVEKKSHSGWLQNQRGILLLNDGSLRQAQTSFERAVKGMAGGWEGHHNLGICLNRLGEKEQALACFEKACAVYGHPTAQVTLARAYASLGRVSEAYDHLEDAYVKDPDSAWVNFHLGAYHASMGLRVPGFDAAPTDLPQAQAYLEKASSRASGFYRAREARNECLRRQSLPLPANDFYEGESTSWELRELGTLYSVSLVRALQGHNEAVDALTMSWDGRFIVSAGHDDSILVWDSLRAEIKARLRGHAGAVRSVTVSADASIMASGSDDGTIKFWQLPSGPNYRTLKKHVGPVTAVSLNPAGSILMSGGDDKKVYVWDSFSGDCRLELNGHESRVSAVAVSFDGLTGVSCGVDRRINYWDLLDGTLLASFEEQGLADIEHGAYGDVGEEIYSVSLSSDMQYLLTGGSGQVVCLRRISDGSLVRVMEGHEKEIRAVSMSPDGRFALSGGWDRSVRLWNLTTGECIRSIPAHEHQVTAVHACSDGRFGLSGSLDRSVKVWEWKEEPLPLAPGRPPLLLATAKRAYFAGAAQIIATRSVSQAAELIEAGQYDKAWTLLRKTQSLPGKAHDSDICALLCLCVENGRKVGLKSAWCTSSMENKGWQLRVAWSPDSSLLASGGLDGCISLWNAEDGESLGWLEGHGREIASLDFSADCSHLISSSYDHTIRNWDLEQGQTETVLRGHSAEVTCSIISRHMPMVLSSSMNGQTYVWNLESGKLLRELNGHEGVVFAVGLALSDRLCATGGSDRRVLLWELPQGKQIAELTGHTGPITSLSFSPDCRFLASGSEDGRVIVWDVIEHKEVQRLAGHKGAVRSVNFSASGFLASCGDDTTFRVWSDQGEELLCQSGHDSAVRWVRFSPNEHYLATVSNDAKLKVWALDWEVDFSEPTPQDCAEPVEASQEPESPAAEPEASA